MLNRRDKVGRHAVHEMGFEEHKGLHLKGLQYMGFDFVIVFRELQMGFLELINFVERETIF